MRSNANEIKMAMDSRGSVLLANDQMEELKEKFVKVSTSSILYIGKGQINSVNKRFNPLYIQNVANEGK